ncbi:MAG: hypothetical protein QOI05_1959 [Bradyrhizobium sp.]|jgi:hypothetical protein|nr:hypothetical protein [Bradyrhizobium sp.]
MNRIVLRHFPASKLPDEMRAAVDPSSTVTVTIDEEEKPPEKVMSLEEIFAARRPPFRTAEEIDTQLRRDRDEWDD